jgi:hypothetical protein
MTMKRILISTASAVGVFVAATIFSNLPVQGHDNDKGRDGRDERNGESEDELEVQTGFRISPVKLDLTHKDPELVGLGSYIVNAQGGCNDCHTCPSYLPGHSPATPNISSADVIFNDVNYLAGGVHFGPFVSRNITPDATGKPAGLTLEEFHTVIRTGHDPDNPNMNALLQVMPWPIFRHMTGRDLDAIYSFLSAIPRAQPGTCSGAGE